jgi:hypothetical protein
MINRRLGNMHIMNVPSAFSRTSSATNDDGTTVSANMPRFGVNGVKIEEMTVNIQTDSNFTTFVDTTINLSSIKKSTFTINGVSHSGVTWVQDSVNDSVYAPTIISINNPVLDSSRKITFSAWIKTNLTSFGKCQIKATIDGAIYYLSQDCLSWTTSLTEAYIFDNIVVLNQWIRWSMTTPALPAGNVTNIVNVPMYRRMGYFTAYVTGWQTEFKAYATSLQKTAGVVSTRAAEQLTIPASSLKPFNSAVELSLYVTTLHSIISTILDTRDSSQTNQNNDLIVNRTATGGWYMSVGYGSGYEELTSTSQPLVVSTVTRIGVRIDTSGIVTLWVNGVKILTSTHELSLLLGSTISVGSTYLATQQIDGYIQPLRISDITRSDMEMGNTGTLVIDYFTTYFLSLVSNLTPRTF